MDAFGPLMAVITGLLILAGASLGWGSDSRDPMPDDHHR
jgi:hypothetical protein